MFISLYPEAVILNDGKAVFTDNETHSACFFGKSCRFMQIGGVPCK
jgi:hypothetical protein